MTHFPERRREALEAVMKDEVVRVAGEVVRGEGYAALTMERVAHEVGVARATLYNYFADADAMLNLVEERAFAPVAAAVDDIAAGAQPAADKLAAIATLIFTSLNRDRALALALFCKREPEGRRAANKAKLRNRMLAVVRRIVAEGTARGELRAVPPDLAAESFLGTVSGLIDTMLSTGELKPAVDVVPALMDLLIHGVGRPAEPTGRATAGSPSVP